MRVPLSFRGSAILGFALAVSAGPATAAEARRSPTPQAPKVEEPVGTWTSATPSDRECSRTRRKFWQAEEGWIVRTVVTCR